MSSIYITSIDPGCSSVVSVRRCLLNGCGTPESGMRRCFPVNDTSRAGGHDLATLKYPVSRLISGNPLKLRYQRVLDWNCFMRADRLRSPFCIVSTATTSSASMGWGVMHDDLGDPQGLFMVREHISRGISARLRSVL